MVFFRFLCVQHSERYSIASPYLTGRRASGRKLVSVARYDSENTSIFSNLNCITINVRVKLFKQRNEKAYIYSSTSLKKFRRLNEFLKCNQFQTIVRHIIETSSRVLAVGIVANLNNLVFLNLVESVKGLSNIDTTIMSNSKSLGITPNIPVWEACGGYGHTGSTECDSSSVCNEVNEWYSRCEPRPNDPNRINEWDQCGGITYYGNTSCQSWLNCVKIHNWYSQCEFYRPYITITPSQKIPVYGTCGGLGHTGITECDISSVCTEVNEWYSRCEPKQNDPSKVNEYGQCEGLTYSGNNVCQTWLTCVKKNNWFWQCEMKSDLSTSNITNIETTELSTFKSTFGTSNSTESNITIRTNDNSTLNSTFETTGLPTFNASFGTNYSTESNI
ncbi:fungal cellulose binding domain-containing, partial [Brachionus plicatilis]